MEKNQEKDKVVLISRIYPEKELQTFIWDKGTPLNCVLDDISVFTFLSGRIKMICKFSNLTEARSGKNPVRHEQFVEQISKAFLIQRK